MPRRTAPQPPAPTATARGPAIVIGPNEDHRRLVRGLLLMHHRPVDVEAAGLDAVPPPTAAAEPRLLVYVPPSGGATWSSELRGALSHRSDLRAIVVLPLDDATTRRSAARAGARAVLGRPFTSAEFWAAVDRLDGEPAAAHVPRGRGPRSTARP